MISNNELIFSNQSISQIDENLDISIEISYNNTSILKSIDDYFIIKNILKYLIKTEKYLIKAINNIYLNSEIINL